MTDEKKFQIFDRLHFLYEKKRRNLDNLAKKNIENSFMSKLDDSEGDGMMNEINEKYVSSVRDDKVDKNRSVSENNIFDRSYHNDDDNNDNDDNGNDENDNNFSEDMNHIISRNTFKIKTNLTDWKNNLISELRDIRKISKVKNEIQNHKIKNQNFAHIKNKNKSENQKMNEYIYEHEYEYKRDIINMNNAENESFIEIENKHIFSENNFLLNIAVNYETIATLSASFLNLRNNEYDDKKDNENEDKTNISYAINNINTQNINDYVTECHIKNDEIASNYEKSDLSNDVILRHENVPFLTDLTEYGNDLIDENNEENYDDYNNDYDYDYDNNNNYHNYDRNTVIVTDNESNSIIIINNDNDRTSNYNDINNDSNNNNNNNKISNNDYNSININNNNHNHNYNVDNNNNNSNSSHDRNNNNTVNININNINNKSRDIRVEMYEHLCTYGIAVVVKNEGSAVRDNINMDDSDVIGRYEK